MTDAEFLRAFESGSLPHFRHLDHLRLAWLRIRALGPAAGAAVARDIETFAIRAGAARKFDAALTARWVGRVAAADAASRPETFEELLAAHPDLLTQERKDPAGP